MKSKYCLGLWLYYICLLKLNFLLISFDIVNLYSNIPHELGQEALSSWLYTCPELIPAIFSKDFILKGLKLILENKKKIFQ